MNYKIIAKCDAVGYVQRISRWTNRLHSLHTKQIFRAERLLSDIFSKKSFVHDNERTIQRWPWKFEPLGQMGSNRHLKRE